MKFTLVDIQTEKVARHFNNSRLVSVWGPDSLLGNEPSQQLEVARRMGDEERRRMTNNTVERIRDRERMNDDAVRRIEDTEGRIEGTHRRLGDTERRGGRRLTEDTESRIGQVWGLS